MTTSRTVSEAWKCVSTCGEAGIDSRYRTPAGCRAVFQAVHDEAFGVMVALRGTDIVRVPLAEATSQLKLVPPQRYAEAEIFFG